MSRKRDGSRLPGAPTRPYTPLPSRLGRRTRENGMESMQGHVTGRAPTRALGALFLLGAVLSASTLVLPADPNLDRLAVGLLDAGAVVAGAVLLLAGSRLPRASIPGFLGAAIL